VAQAHPHGQLPGMSSAALCNGFENGDIRKLTEFILSTILDLSLLNGGLSHVANSASLIAPKYYGRINYQWNIQI
jgi:hypothetical protein